MNRKMEKNDLERAIKGLLQKGNIGEGINERVRNPDGSTSTVRTLSFNDGRGEIVVPTVFDGAVHSDDDSIERYYRTGKHFGFFDSVDNAIAYSKSLHDKHEQELNTNPKINKRKR